MADPAPDGVWFLLETLLASGFFTAYLLKVGFIRGYSRTIIMPGSQTEEPVPALKPSDEETICWGQAAYVRADKASTFLQCLSARGFNISVLPFILVDSRDEPDVFLHALVCESSVDSRETMAMQIAMQACPCTHLFTLDEHLREIGELCFKSAGSVKGFHGTVKKGHADWELGQLVNDVRRLSWERMSNTQSNCPQSLIAYEDAKFVEKIWARVELFLDRVFGIRGSLALS